MSLTDTLINQFHSMVETLCLQQRVASRPNPADTAEEAMLSPSQKKHIAGLMRVNHSGEVCAQALYQGQALTARLPSVRDKMQQAAREEIDHLAWCEQRLAELGYQPSVLNPLWYVGSFTLGAVAGMVGDRWSLGFVAETERQVCQHLHTHLSQIPATDQKTAKILEQMHVDESCHATVAIESGGAELPDFIKLSMRYSAKLMTQTTYYL